jgi:hypothetical protein
MPRYPMHMSQDDNRNRPLGKPLAPGGATRLGRRRRKHPINVRDLSRRRCRRAGRWTNVSGFGLPKLRAALAPVALAVAALAVSGCGHVNSTSTATAGKLHSTPARQAAPRRLLYANRIGDVRFGQTATRVDAELTRLLGPPDAKYVVEISCGSDHYSEWDGLDVRPAGVPGSHRYFRAQLAILFKRSHFVGYWYTNNHYIARDAPWSEVSYPLDSSYAQQVLHGPRLTLATAQGLVLGDTLARARRLYGQAFRETTEEQGTPPGAGRVSRLPVWEVSTPSARIGGGIYTATQGGSFYASSQPGIWWIGAGEGPPNTPCH